MKKPFFLLLIIIFSCQQENESFVTYEFLHQEFEYSTRTIRSQIAENLKKEKLIKNELANVYDSLTSQYLDYLDKTYSELLNDLKPEYYENSHKQLSKTKFSNELFFVNYEYSEKGADFVSKMKNYRIEILKLVDNENLEDRINFLLQTKDVTTRNAKKIKYLNYHYKDLPLISVLTYIKHKENSIVLLENDFLKNILLKE